MINLRTLTNIELLNLLRDETKLVELVKQQPSALAHRLAILSYHVKYLSAQDTAKETAEAIQMDIAEQYNLTVSPGTVNIGDWHANT